MNTVICIIDLIDIRDKICSVDGCERSVFSLKTMLCDMHYCRYRVHGSVDSYNIRGGDDDYPKSDPVVVIRTLMEKIWIHCNA